jgi:metal-responsive CopG/Arc/MetJ family transcriptional regulator
MERSITPVGRVSTSLPSEMLEKVEAFAAETKLNRSQAIEALIALGLKAQPPRREPTLPRHSFA